MYVLAMKYYMSIERNDAMLYGSSLRGKVYVAGMKRSFF